MDWKNHLEQKSDPRNWTKNSKNQSEIAACQQKTTTENSNFCSNTVFSLYFKIRAKKNTRRKTTRFFAPFTVAAWPKSLLQFDFKNYENVWTDLKKRIAPQYNSNSLNCKNKRRPMIAPAIAGRLLIIVFLLVAYLTLNDDYLALKLTTLYLTQQELANSVCYPDWMLFESS